MSGLIYRLNRLHDLVLSFRALDFVAPLLLRLFLAPVMIVAGYTKLESFSGTASWLGESLGMPFPTLMAALVVGAELGGGILLLVGLATRYVAVPLMITMIVAACTVHWDNGWYAIAPSSPQHSSARVLASIGVPAAGESLENSVEVGQRLDRARSILRQHGNYSWLTEKGGFVILQNGIEFAATYFLMLLVLFFTGAGRFLSIDYWIRERFRDIQETE